jgi:membrane-associated protein
VELLRTLLSGEKLLALLDLYLNGWWAYAIPAFIVFAETGLLVGFLLPGDSLLFVLGVLAGTGRMNVWLLMALLAVAAIVGDAVGFALGRRAGPAIFAKRGWMRPYLERTREFYSKHGGQTIVLARFVPIIRTFAPFVAGVASMNYRRFAAFNIFGGIGWVYLITLIGYYAGGIGWVRQYFDKIILAIVFVSVIPVGLEVYRFWRNASSER